MGHYPLAAGGLLLGFQNGRRAVVVALVLVASRMVLGLVTPLYHHRRAVHNTYADLSTGKDANILVSLPRHHHHHFFLYKDSSLPNQHSYRAQLSYREHAVFSTCDPRPAGRISQR